MVHLTPCHLVGVQAFLAFVVLSLWGKNVPAFFVVGIIPYLAFEVATPPCVPTLMLGTLG